MIRLAAFLAVVTAGAALAEDDPMEEQRCVWRCLADSPGAGSAEYDACVAAQCGGPAPVQVTWAAGPTSDGAGFHASAEDPATGNRLSVLCGRGRGVFLGLFGPEGPDATLTFVVDADSRPLPFVSNGEGYYAAVDPGVIAAMKAGYQVQVLNGVGTVLVSVPLEGAATAIAAAEAGCR